MPAHRHSFHLSAPKHIWKHAHTHTRWDTHTHTHTHTHTKKVWQSGVLQVNLTQNRSDPSSSQ